MLQLLLYRLSQVREKPVLTKYLADITAAKSEFIEKRVRILGATRSHEGLYQCVASNTIGTVVKNAQVEVISRTRVSIASQDGDREITVQAGGKLKLPCRVDNDVRYRQQSQGRNSFKEEFMP